MDKYGKSNAIKIIKLGNHDQLIDQHIGIFFIFFDHYLVANYPRLVFVG